jgi:hypothetical protein
VSDTPYSLPTPHRRRLAFVCVAARRASRAVQVQLWRSATLACAGSGATVDRAPAGSSSRARVARPRASSAVPAGALLLRAHHWRRQCYRYAASVGDGPVRPPALPLPAGAPQRCYASSAPVGGESPVRSQAATDPYSLLPSLPAGALPLGRFGSQPAPVVSFCWHRPGVSAPTRRALREGPGWPFSDLRASWFRRNGPYWEKPAVGAARQVLQPDD